MGLILCTLLSCYDHSDMDQNITTKEVLN